MVQYSDQTIHPKHPKLDQNLQFTPQRSPKRDYEHPRHFYMGVPQGGLTPIGSTGIFPSKSPVSLTEKSSFSSLSKVETLTFPTQETESLLYTIFTKKLHRNSSRKACV